jgi:hypothetical protein
MACSLDTIKESVMEDVSKSLTSKVKGLKQVKPGVFEMHRSRGVNLNKVYERVQAAREDVRKFANKSYGVKFENGWSKMDRTHPNKITVSLHFPSAVEQLLRVKLGLISIEDANSTQPFLKDAENFSRDALLSHQEFMSDTKFYAEHGENIPTLAKPKYILNEDGIYDDSLEFEYDKTRETNEMITDAELFRLLNDDLNIC